MKSIHDIQLTTITSGKSYWNSSRPLEEELMYFLLIDRFHDGKQRNSVSSTTGFGNEETLKSRCGGTLQGIIRNISYIHEMGFTSMWISPFLQNNPESYHGYSIENFLEVDAQFGTKEDLVELIAAAHKLNMRVFFDVVINHTGDNWSYKVANPVYKNDIQYSTKAWRYNDLPIPIELRDFNRYNRKGRVKNWEATPETWNGDIFELKDLVQDHTAVGLKNLELMVAVYSYWFALTDCDGFRIDTAKHIQPDWLNQFIDRIKKFTQTVGKKDFFVFAEIVGGQSLIEQYTHIDGYLDFQFHFHSVPLLLGQQTKKELLLADTSGESFLPIRFLDNHDQIGQMPKHRIGYRMTEAALINLLRAFLLLPGIPCIYYGTEQGLKGKGRNDGAIRECLFNPTGDTDLLSDATLYWKTIRQFSEFRKQWQLFQGSVSSCSVETNTKIHSISLQISNLSSVRYLIYNLSAYQETVCIKQSPLITRTKKIVVYLYNENPEVQVEILEQCISISMVPYGFILFELRELL